MLLLLPALALADCDAAALSAALTRAEEAFAAMESTAFATSMSAARATADCLTDVPDPGSVARLHRLLGLQAFLAGEQAAAEAAFAAARAAAPDYRFPESLVPAEHPVLAAYLARESSADRQKLPAPANGQLFFDGKPTRSRPIDVPTLAQLVGDDGDAATSAYLSTEAAMFKYATPKSKKGPNIPLTVAAAGALVAGGALYAAAAVNHDEYYSTDERDSDLRDTTNALFVSSVAAGVIGIGSGVGAVVTGKW